LDRKILCDTGTVVDFADFFLDILSGFYYIRKEQSENICGCEANRMKERAGLGNK